MHLDTRRLLFRGAFTVGLLGLLTACTGSQGSGIPASGSPTSSTGSASGSASASEASQPTPPAREEAQARVLVRSVAHGYFEFEAPSTWTVEELEVDPSIGDRPDAGHVQVLNEDGVTMAEFVSGGEPFMDMQPGPDAHRYTKFDSGPALSEGNDFTFDALGADGDEASLALSPFDVQAEVASELAREFTYEGGSGAFHRAIGPDTELAGVDPAVKGLDRLKAYTETREYQQIKAMLISLQQAKRAPTPPPSAAECVGASYAYDLTDSELGCAEAKAFMEKMESAPISTGARGLVGLGTCQLPWKSQPGYCQVDDPDTTFSYTQR